MFLPRTRNLAHRRSGIKPLWIKLIAVGCAVFSGVAYAAGFGEIMLHSRIGESLLAEVPLITGGKEITDAGCFSLTPMPGADLPVVSNARIRLINTGGNPRLVIIGNKPLNEPIFTISLHAACGIDLQRDFVLMPEAPASPVEVVDSRVSAPSYRPPQMPSNDFPRRRIEAVSASESEAADFRKITKKTRATPPTDSTTTPRPARASKTKPAPTGDRLLLGTAPAELNPPASDQSAPTAVVEMENRLLKMETSLHSLNQELDTLSSSLTVSKEVQAAKHELQIAQSLQTTSVSTTTPPPAPVPGPRSSWANWLELMISAVLGGSIAAGIATWAGRRKTPPPQSNRVVDINKFAIKAKASRKVRR